MSTATVASAYFRSWKDRGSSACFALTCKHSLHTALLTRPP
jgi:hypothetical protein